ncbi:tetratricopeptide repeat protein [Desulfovibrio sulfodismutans]|uniref:Tetratricopeptide repeat protein n=2 Tax=Desulfolutivibrio sulfodismutans TaxID=63561 RepID=A0A7K3NQX0_9BACT|nr:tetratricopeptide repeat protein [Desulfolutivibrio sulfodismutans]NDY58622.1 tetratricopeptide repeat protein [Desulfolutivibrio sulfodismutans]QLA12567.1 tetratricopeptide repeat protein [Desulfolutivibrio sulfodismutans DSM 3696]
MTGVVRAKRLDTRDAADQKAGMERMMRMLLTAMLVFGMAGMAGPFAAGAASLEDELFFAADAYYRGLDARAIGGFEDVLKKDPANDYALARLGVLLAEKGDLDAATQRFQNALAVDPENLFALKWLGILALRRGDQDQAARRFQAMLDADPGNAQATAWQGVALMLEGDPVAAVERFAAASAADADDPGLHYLLSLAYASLGLPENARLELETTLELRPTDVPALTRLGTLFYRQGQRDLAEASWRQAMTVEPGYVEARFCLSRSLADAALAAQAEGNEAKAGRLWMLALEADPANGEALAAQNAASQEARPTPDAQRPNDKAQAPRAAEAASQKTRTDTGVSHSSEKTANNKK